MLFSIISIIFISSIPRQYAQTSYGCEIGWRLFEKSCYRAVGIHSLGITTTTVTFDAARDYCKSNGGDLTSIHNAFENLFIQANLSLSSGYRYWIGLQISPEGELVTWWTDGTPFDYNNLDTSSVGPLSNASVLSAYITLNSIWAAEYPSTPIAGVICKRPAIQNMPTFHNGSGLGNAAAHDPTILKTQNGQYIVYSTANDISARISDDRQTFSCAGYAFPDGLPWIQPWTKGNICHWTKKKQSLAETPSCVWAPDTSVHNGQYYMYYSVSSLGSKDSAIGLAISPSGRPGNWTDLGMMFNSTPFSWNAIDPNLFVDDDGRWYLVFGSFWTGIWQYEMDPSTGFIKAGAENVHLAQRFAENGAMEGSGMFKKGSYYYLQASWDHCCRSLNSTYRTIIGRSTSPQGPFVDKQGKPMLEGGGSELLVTQFPIIGPGGAYVYTGTDHALIVYHYYDGLNNGQPRLGINYLGWTDDGWPFVY